MKVIRMSEFQVVGKIISINLEYKTKQTGDTIPVCEIEIEVHYNGVPDALKITAFYDKAEKTAADVEVGDWVIARGRIKGAKGGAMNSHSTSLWLSFIEKAREVPQ